MNNWHMGRVSFQFTRARCIVKTKFTRFNVHWFQAVWSNNGLGSAFSITLTLIAKGPFWVCCVIYFCPRWKKSGRQNYLEYIGRLMIVYRQQDFDFENVRCVAQRGNRLPNLVCYSLLFLVVQRNILVARIWKHAGSNFGRTEETGKRRFYCKHYTEYFLEHCDKTKLQLFPIDSNRVDNVTRCLVREVLLKRLGQLTMDAVT